MRSFNTYRQLLPLVLLIATSASAQRQYWGIAQGSVDTNNPVGLQGVIVTDSVGADATVLYRFGSPGVGLVSPSSGLLGASDGLVYCYTSWFDSLRIVSFDPVTDSVRIVNAFPRPGFQFNGIRGSAAPFEGQAGRLVDGVQAGSRIFGYNMASQQLSSLITIPPDAGGNYGTLGGNLLKANNGKIYVSQAQSSTLGGRLVVIDLVNNSYIRWPILNDPAIHGPDLNWGPMVQHGDNIITLCTDGGPGYSKTFRGYGVLGSFNINTNTYQPLNYFNSAVHNPLRGFVRDNNGVLYGEAFGDTIAEQGATQSHYGCIYSYDPSTNDVTRLHSYGDAGLGWGVTGFSGFSGLLAASNGKLYGSFKNGIFEYDPLADTLLLRAPLMFTDTNGVRQGYGLQAPMIEICRKPNYKPRPTTSFNVCAGASFFYDLKNVNATSVVWRRNGIVVPGQVNQLLQFNAIAESDEGVWTCTLTNECGVTEPPAITITVNPGTFTTTTISGDTLLCGTGDVAVLTGNNGGSWSGPANSTPNGTNTPTASADLPGTYYLQYTQACGLSMSNLLQVVYLDSARAPFMTSFGGGDDSTNLCVGDAFLLGGNSPGPWGDLPTGVWQDGTTTATYTVQDTGLYFITVSNSCNSDTSNTLVVFRPDTIDFPPVFFTDAMGLPADQLLCLGDSVRVNVPFGVMYSLLYEGNSLGGFIDLFNPITIQDAGNYAVIGYDPCQAYYDTTFFSIVVDALPPPTAEIIPDLPQLLGCDQDTATLSSAAPFSYWTWTDAFGEQRADSTDQLLVDWSIGNNGFYALYNYNGCGNSEPDFIQVIGTPAPTVLYAEAIDTLCFSDALQTLSPGTPPGGTYSGPGVTDNTFNPAAAGIGEHTLTYSYSDGTCTGFAQDVIAVDICQAVRGEDVSEGLWISPNPTTGSFALTLGPTTGLALVILHDATGAVVRRTAVQGPGPHTLSADGLAAGTYEVVVVWKDSLARGRLLLVP